MMVVTDPRDDWKTFQKESEYFIFELLRNCIQHIVFGLLALYRLDHVSSTPFRFVNIIRSTGIVFCCEKKKLSKMFLALNFLQFYSSESTIKF